MSPEAQNTLLYEIVPALRKLIPVHVRERPTEDHEELTQDAIALAAQMVDSCDKRDKIISPCNIAYFALRQIRSGRRSYYKGGTDALSHRARILRGIELDHLDAPVSTSDHEKVSKYDAFPSRGADPAQMAAHRIDWEEMLSTLTVKEREILDAMLDGHGSLTPLGKSWNMGQRSISRLAVQLRKKIAAFFGADEMQDIPAPAYA